MQDCALRNAVLVYQQGNGECVEGHKRHVLGEPYSHIKLRFFFMGAESLGAFLGAIRNKEILTALEISPRLSASNRNFTQITVLIWWQKHKGKDVLATLRQWAKDNPALRAYDEGGRNPSISRYSFGPQRRTGREMDLVAMMEKHLSSEGSRSLGEQGSSSYRY